MRTVTLNTSFGAVKLHYTETTIEKIEIGERVFTESYLDGGEIILSDYQAPYGVIWPLSFEQVENLSLTGGMVTLFADDLYSLRIVPDWWTVECQMAVEGDAPSWPLAEEAKMDPVDGIITSILGMFRYGTDEEQDNLTEEEKLSILGWDGESLEEEEGEEQ
jgi:hypothetical protein